MLRALAGALLALMMSACASNNTRNYDKYLDTVQKVESSKAIALEASRMAKSNEYASLQAGCAGDSACVANVAAFKAITDVVAALGNGGNSMANIAAPPREPTLSEQALAWASVIVPGASTILGITETNKTQRHMSDNAVQQTESQNSMWGTIFTSQASAFADAAATPSLVVGGNYGTTNTAGGHLVSGNRNTIGTNNFNSGRLNSAGPYDSNDGNCRDGDSNCPIVDPTP